MELPHSLAMRAKVAATVERVDEVLLLKYSVILAAGPEDAAEDAAAARERQLERALRVAVRRVPVQSDWTTARFCMWSRKARRILDAAAPSMEAVTTLEVRGMAPVMSLESASA